MIETAAALAQVSYIVMILLTVERSYVFSFVLAPGAELSVVAELRSGNALKSLGIGVRPWTGEVISAREGLLGVYGHCHCSEKYHGQDNVHGTPLVNEMLPTGSAKHV